ncbi:PAAR domain-containing protein [Parasedimentitalea marina]|uniref:PAAR domain-containing protein n=1 Tax=Parasedimentitalea marina TaxID=2483033 RepID=UPI001EE99875|nr:PAAR domain-containing protein [Parasedimentitalea marina]
MTVLVGKLPAARVTDMVLAVPPHPIAKGSGTVLISGLPAARILDNAACGGMIVKGEFTVLVGG